MVAFEHNLTLDYREGRYQASCTCGHWQTLPIRSRVEGLRKIFDQIEREHQEHVDQVQSRECTLAESSLLPLNGLA